MSERSGTYPSRTDGRARSRSRSRHSVSSDRSGNGEGPVIIIQNLPYHWEFDKVRSFIKEKDKNLSLAVKYVKVVRDNNNMPTGESLVEFTSRSWAKKAINLLNGAGCEGRALVIEFSHQYTGSLASLDGISKQKRIWLPWQISPKRTIQTKRDKSKFTDNMDTYGLNISFLKKLGIKLPLLSKIFIANLDARVNKEKLEDIFSHAGVIKNTLILKKDDKHMGKIEYDHPVEAVQAISMLNNQELYGKRLVVHMDNSPDSFQRQIPDGLVSFGPGLGTDGEPMTGVRTIVELQKIKTMLVQELQKPAENKFSMNQLQVDTMLGNQAANLQNNITPFNWVGNNMFSMKQNAGLFPTPLHNILNPTAQAFQVQQSLLQPTNDLATTLASLQSQTLAQNVASVPVFTQNVGPSQSEWAVQSQSQVQTQNPYGSRQQSDYSDYSSSRFDSKSFGDNFHHTNDHRQTENDHETVQKSISSDMVVFDNLPPSVTLQALTNKMRDVGEVKLAETTGKGRAIVRFHKVIDAERCIKLFDRSKVDGQIIDVQFF